MFVFDKYWNGHTYIREKTRICYQKEFIQESIIV